MDPFGGDAGRLSRSLRTLMHMGYQRAAAEEMAVDLLQQARAGHEEGRGMLALSGIEVDLVVLLAYVPRRG